MPASRVFPALPNVRPGDPGDAFHIPPQGGGRLDNPDLFRILYMGDSPSGAIAEAFGRFPERTAVLLLGSRSLPGSIRALARYHLPDNEPICDLDAPARLLALNLRPSYVVSRDYSPHPRLGAADLSTGKLDRRAMVVVFTIPAGPALACGKRACSQSKK